MSEELSIKPEIDDNPWGVGHVKEAASHQSSESTRPSKFFIDIPNHLKKTTSNESNSTDDDAWQITSLPNMPPSIGISISPQKVGIVFKHVNYIIHDVHRRYSDFVWLSEALQLVYPFRLHYPVPPKKLLPNDHFLEERRRALSRFITFIHRHPLYGKDEMVKDFLVVDDFSLVKQKYTTLKNELSKKDEVHDAPQVFETKLAMVKDKLNLIYPVLTTLVETVQRSSLHEKAMVSDIYEISNQLFKIAENMIFVNSGEELSKRTSNGLFGISDHYQKLGDTQLRSAQSNIDIVMENLKSYRELTYALIDMINRLEKQTAALQIDALQQRIKAQQDKLESGSISEKEIHRINTTLPRDHLESDTKTTLAQFIRFCVWEEILYFDSQQIILIDLFKRISAENVKISEEFKEIWLLFEQTSITMGNCEK